MARRNNNEFGWALAPLVLSGAAALGLQVLWTRRLMDVLGANVESSARVFGCFFLGFALGSAAAALALPRIRRPWRGAAWVELGIVIFSLPALLLPFWSGPIWPALGPEKLAGWQGTWVKFVLSVLVVLPPAVLIGMTLPLVIAGVCGPRRGLGRHGIWVYAAYTLGGGLGLATVAGWTLRWWGATGSLLFLAGSNLLAALLFLKFDHGWKMDSPEGESEVAAPAAEVALPPTLGLILSFFSGAGVMALELLGLQLLNLKTPVAFYPQATVLFCAVVLLAAAAGVVPWAVNRMGGCRSMLLFSLAAAGLAIAAAPLLFMTVTASNTALLGYGKGFAPFLLALGKAALIAFGPAMILAGLVFPVLISAIRCSHSHSAGQKIGGLLAVNGLGGVLGAELTYRFLLPAFNVHVALGILGAWYGLLSLGLWMSSPKRRALPLGIAISSIALTLLLLGTALKRLPVFLRHSTFNVLQVRSGREGTLAVVERTELGRAMFLDNQYMLGCTKAAPDMQRQAHLPLLLHPAPKRVCFLGLGTGITASGALHHEAVESVTVYELSRLVADAAGQYFTAYNQEICSSPKVVLRVQDAGPQLSAAKEAYDVIIGDLFTPWRPGEARLCSREQFEAARGALRPGGVFCQWLPMTQLTQEHFDLIATTFQRIFGEVYLFRNHFRSKSLPLALIGFKEGGLDWRTVASRCDSERKAGHLRDPVCRHPEGLGLLYLGKYRPGDTSTRPLNTLGNLEVELAAGRRLLAGSPGEYFSGTGDVWLVFVQRQLETVRTDGQTPESARWSAGGSSRQREPNRVPAL